VIKEKDQEDEPMNTGQDQINPEIAE